MSHLEDRLSAFVDGELGHGERDRVLSHLTRCAECRSEAHTLRTLKQRLRTLGAPGPTTDFLDRLSGISVDAPEEPPWPPLDRSAGFGTAPPPGSGRPLGTAPPAPDHRGAPQRGGRTASRSRLGWGRARYAVVGASVVAVTLGAAFLGGEDTAEAPVVTPALTDYAVEHTVVSTQVPLADPAAVPAVAQPPSSGGGPVGADSVPATSRSR